MRKKEDPLSRGIAFLVFNEVYRFTSVEEFTSNDILINYNCP